MLSIFYYNIFLLFEEAGVANEFESPLSTRGSFGASNI